MYEKTETREIVICGVHLSKYENVIRKVEGDETCGITGCNEPGVVVTVSRYKVTIG